mmetsp:Transcript_53688/g.117543  ORF Transcript_53688/g.117543 Transcript_53688/m.117543 type:complete len:220 (+) Transcript_53688:142-801(+)
MLDRRRSKTQLRVGSDLFCVARSESSVSIPVPRVLDLELRRTRSRGRHGDLQIAYTRVHPEEEAQHFLIVRELTTLRHAIFEPNRLVPVLRQLFWIVFVCRIGRWDQEDFPNAALVGPYDDQGRAAGACGNVPTLGGQGLLVEPNGPNSSELRTLQLHAARPMLDGVVVGGVGPRGDMNLHRVDFAPLLGNLEHGWAHREGDGYVEELGAVLGHCEGVA